MSQTTVNQRHGFVELEESAAKQIGFLTTILASVVTLLRIAFSIGITWATLQRYEEKVDNQHAAISELKDNLSDAKKSFSVFGNDHLDMAALEDIDAVCPSGSAVVGILHKSGHMLIRCASLGKAIWTSTDRTTAAPTVR